MKRWLVVATLTTFATCGGFVAWLAWFNEAVNRAQHVIDHRERVKAQTNDQ